MGIDIVRRALQAPCRQIASNAGADGSVVVGKLMEQKSNTFGYNAATDTYEDLIKAGVIDPTKVVRTALQDAASIAGLLITTEAMVAEKPEPAGAGGGMPDMGDMGGMGRHGWNGVAWASEPAALVLGKGPGRVSRPFLVSTEPIADDDRRPRPACRHPD